MSTGNGIYNITPQGLSPIQVYCDMTYNSGGWTLIASTDGSTNLMPVIAQITTTTTAGILNSSTVIALANLASSVRITNGPVANGLYRMSSAVGTMSRLRSYLVLNNPSMIGADPNSDWLPADYGNNMYFFCNPDYNSPLSNAVYHACGNGSNGMHWIPGWINSWDYQTNNNLNLWVR